MEWDFSWCSHSFRVLLFLFVPPGVLMLHSCTGAVRGGSSDVRYRFAHSAAGAYCSFGRPLVQSVALACLPPGPNYKLDIACWWALVVAVYSGLPVPQDPYKLWYSGRFFCHIPVAIRESMSPLRVWTTWKVGVHIQGGPLWMCTLAVHEPISVVGQAAQSTKNSLLHN